MKTVDDVLCKMRYGVIPKHRHDRELLMNFADRIEVAVKHQFRGATKMIHEEVVVAKMETTTPTCEKSTQVGNAAAMHETLLRCDAIAQLPEIREYKIVKEMRNLIWGVLALPPRNCDIYTMEEQSKRHEEYCKSHSTNGRCVKCPLWQMRLLGINCAIAWANLPSDALEDNKEVENEES